MPTIPRYMELYRTGSLKRRADSLNDRARDCVLCPRQCHARREEAKTGYCRAGFQASVASANAHHGEEPPISGTRGSGTIFFANCTMRCVFCQNYPISQMGNGKELTNQQLAKRMIELQNRGVHNLNLVTPTHYVHAFASALLIAIEEGFRLPIVYNTSGYESLDTLRLLDGIIDVYLPDIKYCNAEFARRYSDAAEFIPHNLAALSEMFRQVGHLRLDEEELAAGGMIVRHLVLPGSEEDSFQTLKLLQEHVAPDCFLSLMSQYFPANKADQTPPLDRKIDPRHYDNLVDWVEQSDFRGWIQPI